MKNIKIVCFLFLFLAIIGLSSCGDSSSDGNNTVTETEPKEITWSEPIKITKTNFSEYLTISLSTSSSTLYVESKKKNKYKKFEKAWVRVYLVNTSDAKYWDRFVIDLDSSGKGTFTSKDLDTLCTYYGSMIDVWPEQCYWSGNYSVGTPVF